MGFVSLLVYIWGRERKGLEDRISDLRADFDELKRAVDKRFDDGNERLSKLTSKIEELPDRMRRGWMDDIDRERDRDKRGHR